MIDRAEINKREGRRRFVALDRDGTIITERHRPITDPDEIELLPGAADGLKHMANMGLGLLIITNQSAVGRGTLEQSQLDAIHLRLREMLAAHGIDTLGIYACTHAPTGGCSCRKPLPGLLEQAAKDLHFQPADCFMIGDKISDLECGRRFGAATLLVRTGYGAEMEQEAATTADYIADGLDDAAKVIERVLSKRQLGLASGKGVQ